MEPPPCVQNAMMTKDKKPFTYTPGGIDLSEIKSPRMARRIERNANFPGVNEIPKNIQPTGYTTGQLPPSALAAMQPQLQVQVFPTGPPPGPVGGPPPPPPPPPMLPLPTQKCITANNEVVERPDMTRIIPENPMALLRKTSGPQPRKSFIETQVPKDSQQQLQTIPYQPQQESIPQAQQWKPTGPPKMQQNWSPQAHKPEHTTPPIQQEQQCSAIRGAQTTSPPLRELRQISPPPIQPQQRMQSGNQISNVLPSKPGFLQKREQSEQPQAKLNTALGTLYIPPLNDQSREAISPQTTPRESALTQSPPTPTLNKAPRPWQTQRHNQQQELPSWAIRGQPISPSAEQSHREYSLSQEQQQMPQMQEQRPNGANIVWITQPQVFQHPGPRADNKQPPQQCTSSLPKQSVESPGVRVIPIKVEGGQIQTPLLNRQQSWGNNPTQSNSFRVIQKLTNTDGDVEDGSQAVTEHGPTIPQQFTQTPAEQIRKLKLSEGDKELMRKFKQGVDEESCLHNEVDPRYRGPAIPSKAFRLLQSMTNGPEAISPVVNAPQVNRSSHVRTIPIQVEDDDESPKAYVHPSQQTVTEPRKYTGSSIPSRSFKMLQTMTAPNSCGPGQTDM